MILSGHDCVIVSAKWKLTEMCGISRKKVS